MLGDMLSDLDRVVVVGDEESEGKALQRLANGEVDLAIVDLELSEGSGFGVLERLGRDRAHYCSARAVVFSTYSHRAVRQRCAELGAEAFFDKADGVDDLLNFVELAASERAADG